MRCSARTGKLGLNTSTINRTLTPCDRKTKRLTAAVGLIFILLFLSTCYDTFNVALKLGSIALTIGCFLSVAWDTRIAGWAWGYILLISLFLFVQFSYTSIAYQQGIAQFLAASYYFFYCLLIPVFMHLLSVFGIQGLLRKIEMLTLVISVFMLLMGFMYTVFGLNLTEIARFRSGLLRIDAPVVVQIGCVIAAYQLICRNGNKGTHAAICFCSFLAILYVCQSRLAILLLVFAFLLMLAFRRSDHIGLVYISFFAAAIALVALCTIGPLRGILESFSLSSSMGGNTLTRINETNYYLDLISRNPVNGVGLVPFGSAAYSALSGPYGQFYIDDVGIIGALAGIGLWVVAIYVVPMICLIRASFTKGRAPFRILLLAILFYLVGTTFTTLIVYPRFDPTWAFCLALFAQNYDPSTEDRLSTSSK